MTLRFVRSQIQFKDPRFLWLDLLVILLLGAGHLETMVFVEFASPIIVYLDVKVHMCVSRARSGRFGVGGVSGVGPVEDMGECGGGYSSVTVRL